MSKIKESISSGYKETILELNDSTNFSFSEFDNKVDLNYIEYSPDAWYSDHESTISIDESQAKDIIRMFIKMHGSHILEDL